MLIGLPPEYTDKLLSFMGGIIVTGVGAYIVVGQQLAHIKGQLSILLGIDRTVKEHGAKLELLHVRGEKHGLDISQAHQKIRILERSMPPKSIQPK